jgi:translation elongation factor EF-Tu-like GTPase
LASAGSIKAISCKITDADGVSVTTEYVTVTFKEKSNGGAKDKFEMTESEEPINEDFLMYVEDVYTVTGRGTVASGRVAKGKLNKGDTIKIISANGTEKTATVAGIEMFKKMLDTAEKGDNIGLLFNAEIDKTMVARGDSIISADSTYSVTGKLKGTLKLTTKEEGGRATAISEEHSPQFYRSGHDFTGKITGLTDGTINPGETQEDITVTFSSFKGVFYVGQELSGREGGRTIGTFTITSLSSGGRVTRPGTVTRPTTGTDTTEEEEESSTTSGGRVSIPTGKNEYME